MSSSAEALPSPEFSTCPRCGRQYFPFHPDGCWPCRQLRTTGPRLVTSTADERERAAEAETATYYFLESFFGQPDGS